MNKRELLTLLSNCANMSALFAVAQEAAKRLDATQQMRVVIGKRQPCEDLLRIYTARLRRKNDRNEEILGLAETVQMFGECKGQLQGGYAETNDGLTYFWTDEGGHLAGCILQNR